MSTVIKVDFLFRRANLLDTNPWTYHLAEKLYREILESDPNHVDSLINLGCLLLKLGNFTEPRSLFLRVVELDSSNFVARYNMAVLLLEVGHYDRALAYLKEAESLQPENKDLDYYFYRIYRGIGDQSLAARYLAKLR